MILSKLSPRKFLRHIFGFTVLAAAVVCSAQNAWSQLVPGTGRRVTRVGDTFENENWTFHHNFPKSSKNLDQQARYPLGGSNTGRIIESAYRGAPDAVKRVPTPPGGLPGSEGSLLLQTLNSGVPGTISAKSQQDDLLLNVSSRVGLIPARYNPSVVVRVYIPPFEEWDPVSDSSLGIRIACMTTKSEEKRFGLLRRTKRVSEEYWPGFFLQFRSKNDGIDAQDKAMILIRGNHLGQEINGGEITQTGWWTFGMSVTANGQVHYYASPGVDKLTKADHIASTFPYGYRAESLKTFFFNVISRNDNKHWSTRWIIDDPEVYTTGNY